MTYTLEELAKHIGATVEGDRSLKIAGVSDLERAMANEISFFSNPRYHRHMIASKAGAVIVSPNVERPSNKSYLLHDDPSVAFQTVMALFRANTPPLTGFTGCHPTAVIHPTATIAAGVVVGPYAVIDSHVIIGERSYIGPFVYVGPKTTIGRDVVLHPHAVVREGCVVGNGVIIQPGAVIGSCGYGYATDTQGCHTKLDQLGNVVLHDNVEVGANSTIDRARFQSTEVGKGTKIDNLVQIAHNVRIGAHCLVVAQVGIAGSATLGNHVFIGGQAAVNGHIAICDNVRVAACSGISKSILKSGDYGGIPAQPLAEYNKNAVFLRKVEELFIRVKELESQKG